MSAFTIQPFLIELVIAAILGYLTGSIMTALLVCRLLGLPDPRTYGSHNPGATNVARYNVWAGGLTILGDASKAAIPMLVVQMAGFGEHAAVLCGLSAFIGHLFPLSLRKERKGGKGVATFLGFLVMAHSVTALLFVITWLLVFAIVRYSAPAGMTASLLAPIFVWMHHGSPLLIATTAGMTALVLWRHRHDLTRDK